MTTTQLGKLDEPSRPIAPAHRRRSIVLIVAGAVVLAVFVTWLVAFSAAFGVRNLDVQGNRTLSRAEIVHAAAVGHGTPLVRLDTAAITERIERLPDIASAQVSTSFPSTVVITVTERTPVAYLVGSGGPRLVDGTGRQYAAAGSTPAGLPRLVVPTGAAARNTLHAVADVAGALPADLRRHVKSIEALDPNSVTVVLTSNVIVRWGGDDRNEQKAVVVQALRNRSVSQIDVTDPDQPFTRH
ncbi:MAG: cell division protein FtsQ/DivIB [Jatrophihabitans sp.]